MLWNGKLSVFTSAEHHVIWLHFESWSAFKCSKQYWFFSSRS